MTALAQIHIARKDLGLDEDTYRAVLVRVTGKASSGAMSEAERGAVLTEFRRLGWKPQPKKAKGLAGPYAKKIQALWIAAWNIGIVRNKSDQALIAFVRRQTGLDHANWLRDPVEAARVIEALKSWIAREAGVDWAEPVHGRAIAAAQFALLRASDPAYAGYRNVGDWLIKFAPQNPGLPWRLGALTDADWIVVMNHFGEKLRAGLSRKKRAS